MNGFAWNFRPVWPFRKWVYWLGAWNHRRNLQRCYSFLLPVIQARTDRQATMLKDEKSMDMIQWLLEMPVSSSEDGEPIRHAERILHLTFAASAVSSALVLHLIHQVLLYPQHVEALRGEILDCLERYGGWTEKAIANMHLLDSYVREMLRLTPPSVGVFYLPHVFWPCIIGFEGR